MDDFTVLNVHVTQWNLDPLTGGVYSTLAVGGLPSDREQLSQPVSARLVLAGEYTNTQYPATMHGAYHAGERAAQFLDSPLAGTVIVVGAGICGLIAAQRLIDAGKTVTVLEATDHLGGRARVEQRHDGVVIHPGAAWIHGVTGNPIAHAARHSGVTFESWPTSAEVVLHARESQGRLSTAEVAEVEAAISAVEQQLLTWSGHARKAGLADITLREPLRRALLDIADPSIRAAVAIRMHNYYESLMAAHLDDLSFQYGNEPFEYPGGDAYLVSPMTPMIELFAKGLDVRFEHQVSLVSYDEHSVRVEMIDGKTFGADACVVAVPLGPLQSGAIRFDPPLPTPYAESLGKLRMGEKAKVFVEFASKWWGDAEEIQLYPVTPHEDPTRVSLVGTWVDATKLAGVPMLCGFVGGREAIRLQHLSAAAEANPPDPTAAKKLIGTVTDLLKWAGWRA